MKLSIAFAIMLALAVLIPQSSADAQTNCSVNASELGRDASEQDLWERVQLLRVQAGHGAFTWSDALERDALWIAHDMASSGYRGSPANAGYVDTLGRTSGPRALDCGHLNQRASDIYDYGWNVPFYVAADWAVLQAPRLMIDNPEFTVAGLAHIYVPGSLRGHYWVLVAGSSVAPTPTPAPPTATAISPTLTPIPTSTPVPATPTALPRWRCIGFQESDATYDYYSACEVGAW